MRRIFTRTLVFVLLAALLLPVCFAEGAVPTILSLLSTEPDDPLFVADPDEELIFEDEVDPLAAIDGMRNILLIGIDARPGEKTGRSDTMIVLSLDATHRKIKLISLMRDLYVEIPGYKNNRINASYIYGGPELLIRTISQNFGIEIDGYVAVNFSMLAALVDAIGGLDLTVESDYYKDRINAVIREDNKALGLSESDGLLQKSGAQHMTGKQVQAYARYRYGTKTGDFGRTQRQREVVVKLMDALLSRPLAELLALAEANLDKVFTNLTLSDAVALLPAVSALREDGVLELRVPQDGAYESKTISKMSVLVPDRKKTRSAIEAFLNQ